jgi:hypothetical protein
MKTWVRVNEDGRRIGESHPQAVLSDVEVDALLAERDAGATLSELARRWGLSKSGVKGIVDGRRRGQVGPRVMRRPARVALVSVCVVLTLQERSRFERIGGVRWLRETLATVGVRDASVMESD